MTSAQTGQISFSFLELRQLMGSFEDYPNGSRRSADHKNAIFQLVEHIGAMAIPTLVRQLLSGTSSSIWASELLIHLAKFCHSRQRIVHVLLPMLQHSDVPYSCQVAVSEVLTVLGENVPWPSPCSTNEDHSSLSNLASCIASPAKLARAASSLLRELAATDLLEFVEDFSDDQPAVALSLVREFLVRDSLTSNMRSALQKLAISVEASNQPPVVSTHSVPRCPDLRMARHNDGRSALIAYAQCAPRSRVAHVPPSTYRALCLLIDPSGTLQNCEYLEQVPRSTIESLMLRPLAEADYEVFPIAPGTLRQHAIAASHQRLRAGNAMPRSYYLGRDLIDLSDEHLLGRFARAQKRSKNAARLARGTEGRIGECYVAPQKYLRRRGQNESPQLLASELIAHYGRRSTETERSE